MNKLFKELAKRSGIKFIPFEVDDVKYDYEDVTMDGSEDLQKFAESIVKECVTMLERHHLFTEDPRAYLYAISLIEEHFGIEK